MQRSRRQPRNSSVLSVTLTLLLAGCFAPVERESDPSPSTIDRIIGPEHYWVRDDLPPLKELEARTVAIAEFTVEFVKGKYARFEPAALRVDPIQYAPAGAGLVVLGIGRQRADYGEELMKDLPTQLYEDFVRAIEKREVEVVPMQSVTNSAAYKKFKLRESDASNILLYLNPVGSDTGRIRSYIELPVQGLGVVDGATEGETEEVEAAIIKELGVDVVVRARFRIGVHQGRASVERGSEVTLLGNNILGSLSSSRSLSSDESITKDGSFLPIRGYLYEVDPGKYRAAMKTLFPTYLELGFAEVR